MKYFLGLLFVFACSNVELPAGAQLACTDDADCPDNFVCRDALGRCVAIDAIGGDAIAFVTEPVLTRTRVSYEDGFNLSTLQAAFTSTPVVVRVALDGKELACSGGAEIECALDVRALEIEEGTRTIVVTGVDAAGNLALTEVSLTVDRTPPALAAAPIVRYTAAADAIRRDLFALGIGTGTLRIDAIATEALGAEASARLATLPLVPIADESPIAFAFSLELGAGFTGDQGPNAVEFSLVDDVGNAATITVADLVVIDTFAPSAPNTAGEQEIRHVRKPHGDDTAATPRFSVEGLAGATEGRALLVARVGPTPDDLLLGQGLSDEVGAFSVALLPFDAPRVFLSAIDEAGNESPILPVRNISWTAALGGKVRGSLFDNPHALFQTSTFASAALESNLAVEAENVVAFRDFEEALQLQSASQFTQVRTTGTAAIAIGDVGIAYHAGRGTVFFTAAKTPSSTGSSRASSSCATTSGRRYNPPASNRRGAPRKWSTTADATASLSSSPAKPGH